MKARNTETIEDAQVWQTSSKALAILSGDDAHELITRTFKNLGPAPETFGACKKSASSTGVMIMMDKMFKDVEREDMLNI